MNKTSNLNFHQLEYYQIVGMIQEISLFSQEDVVAPRLLQALLEYLVQVKDHNLPNWGTLNLRLFRFVEELINEHGQDLDLLLVIKSVIKYMQVYQESAAHLISDDIDIIVFNSIMEYLLNIGEYNGIKVLQIFKEHHHLESIRSKMLPLS